MILQDVLKEFIYDCEIRNLTKRTIKGYRNNNLRFFVFLESELDITELEKLNSKHIKMYLALLKKQKLSESYANGILKNLRSFLNYCVDEGYIEENPTHKVKWVREPKTIINTFTNEEVSKMLDVFKSNNYLNTRNNCIIAMFFDTGIRSSELCDITDYDIRGNHMKINGKGNKERNVPITPLLRKYMIKYERMREGYFKNKYNVDDYYFLSRTGKRLTVETNLNIFKKHGNKINIRDNIRCSPHTARHFYAQSQLKNGLDVYSVSRLLGHESLQITQRYLQSIQDYEILDMAIASSPLMNLKGGRK